jgi:hypothetical protein
MIQSDASIFTETWPTMPTRSTFMQKNNIHGGAEINFFASTGTAVSTLDNTKEISPFKP